MNKAVALNLTAVFLLTGCPPALPPEQTPPDEVRLGALAARQSRAYAEAVTGYFLSLADFEDSSESPGFEQVELFSINPPSEEARLEYILNITRTGAAAMGVTLPPKSALLFAIRDFHDFSKHRLLLLSVYSTCCRDDFTVSLMTDSAAWTSQNQLIVPGWNDVLIDIKGLSQQGGFDARNVKYVGLSLPEAGGAVSFVLDDILLIDNARLIEPAPAGSVFRKDGRDYELALPNRSEAVLVRQGDDGLWRAGTCQAVLQLAPAHERLADAGEQLEVMGGRRVGQVELLESNSVRVRLASTWYFPTRAGEWVSPAMRQVRWEYTFHADGSCVVHAELNNAGGVQIDAARLVLPEPVAWHGGQESVSLRQSFEGTVGRWNWLSPPQGSRRDQSVRHYLQPGRVELTMARAGAHAGGDTDGDGFDQSQGCYFVQAEGGNCRFRLVASDAGLVEAVVRVGGPWSELYGVVCNGRAVRDLELLVDGSVLFVIPGRVDGVVEVEVSGRLSPGASEGGLSR